MENNYKRIRGFLKNDEAKQIADLFTSCFEGISRNEYNNLFLLLKTENRYFNLLTNKNSHIILKMMLLRILAQDMDDKCGTDFTSKIGEARGRIEKISTPNSINIKNSLISIW